MARSLLSNKSDEWETPQWLFDELNRIWRFTLDPCATKENAKCEKFYTIEDDGLSLSWDDECVFMNPPYGNVFGWMEKADFEVSSKARCVVALVAARVDTKWFHEYVLRPDYHWYPIRGRLKFGGCANSAPFPSVIVEMLKKVTRG